MPKDKGPIWITQQGEHIPISEMTDEHLLAAIKMLERNGHIPAEDYHDNLTPDDFDFLGGMNPVVIPAASQSLSNLLVEARNRGYR